MKIKANPYACINLRNELENLFFEIHEEKQHYASKYGIEATLKFLVLIEIVKKTIIQINKGIAKYKNYECTVVLEETEIMFLKDHLKKQTGTSLNLIDIFKYYE